MAVVQKIPRKLEEVLGRDGTHEFIDFFNSSFQSQENLIVQLLENRFEKTVTEEVSKVRLEVSGIRTELKTEIADLRSEMKSDLTKVHESISSQTRWLLSALVSAAVLFPIISRLMLKFLP